MITSGIDDAAGILVWFIPYFMGDTEQMIGDGYLVNIELEPTQELGVYFCVEINI